MSTSAATRSGLPSARSPYEPIESEIIGSAEHATTYAGFDVTLSRRVAIKVFDSNAPNLRQSLRGARASAREVHTNIVQVFDVDDVRRWVVMERMDRSIAIEAKTSPMSAERVRKVLTDALRGLAHLHSSEKLHYAITPENILLDRAGNAKLSDALGFDFGDELNAPESGAVYVAPEILNPATFGAPGPQSDLFCLGLLASRLLLGKSSHRLHGRRDRSWQSNGIEHLRWITSKEEIPSLREFVPGGDAEFLALLNRMMKKHVADRVNSANEALAELDSLASRQVSHKSVVVTKMPEPKNTPPESVHITSGPDTPVRTGSASVSKPARWQLQIDEFSEYLRNPKIVVAVAGVLFTLVVLAGGSKRWTPAREVPGQVVVPLPRTQETVISVYPVNATIKLLDEPDRQVSTSVTNRRQTLTITWDVDSQREPLGRFVASAPLHHEQEISFVPGRSYYNIELTPKLFTRINVIDESRRPITDAMVTFTDLALDKEDVQLKTNSAQQYIHEVGEHFSRGRVRVALAGYTPVHRELTPSDLEECIEVVLKKAGEPKPRLKSPEIALAHMRIRSLPEGADVYVADKKYGVTPLTAHLPAGEHVIRLELSGYEDVRRNVRAVGRGTYSVELRPKENHQPEYYAESMRN